LIQAFQTARLVVFCDSSLKAAAACVYAVGESSSQLLVSKTKVTPRSQMKKVSLRIPRLELVACLLAVTLGLRVASTLDIDASTIAFFTDSRICLCWIWNGLKDKHGAFVRNRLEKIHQLTSPNSWNYVSTTENPSDLATRPGCTVEKLESGLWLIGPRWLTERDWPLQERETIISQTIVEMDSVVTEEVQTFEPVIDLSRFSCLFRVKRTAALIWWWRCAVSRSAAQPSNQTRDPHILDATTLEQGLFLLIRQEQAIGYPIEMSNLSSGQPIPSSSSILSLRPQWDPTRRMLVTVGRENPNPLIIIPRKSQLSLLILAEIHKLSFHSGPELTLARSRESYWIVSGRVAAKQAIRQCMECRILLLKPYPQVEAALPISRTEPSEPFAVTGLDFAGPIPVKGGQRAYIVLFTCALIRAVHLELVPSMSTTDFAQAFRRFEARRGPIRMVYSDNARSLIKFKGMRSDIKWNLLPDRSPWWGGFYERLVQNVKQALRHAIGRHPCDYQELGTILVEIEGIVNARPLVPVSDDPNDPPPIKPESFLKPPIVGSHQPKFKTVNQGRNLVETFRLRRRILNEFWDRWSRTYLRSLHPWRSGTAEENVKGPRVGDLVLVENETRGRYQWPFARIESLIKGRDGVCRAAFVRLGSGRILRRPTKKLFPFEVVQVTSDEPVAPDQTPLQHPFAGHLPKKTSGSSQEPSASVENPLVTRSGRIVIRPNRC
jgi:hypothetical protein